MCPSCDDLRNAAPELGEALGCLECGAIVDVEGVRHNVAAGAFLSVLCDAESAMREDEDSRQWAAAVPVPVLQEWEGLDLILEVYACGDRFDAVVSAAKEAR
jgi:hypothetical protein